MNYKECADILERNIQLQRKLMKVETELHQARIELAVSKYREEFIRMNLGVYRDIYMMDIIGIKYP